MKNSKNFNYPIDVMYQVLGQLVVDNANQHVENKYTLDDLETIDYQYDAPHHKQTLKMFVKVIRVEQNKSIVYSLHKETLETYIVTFSLTENEDGTTNLYYAFDLDGVTKRLETNHRIMSFFFKRRENQKFEAMCRYISMKCDEIQASKGE